MRSLKTLSACAIVCLLGIVSVPRATADVVRTGPNGNTATTTRSAGNGTATRTTTGPNGQSASTTRTIQEDGSYDKTYSGPEGGSVTTTTTVSEGQVNRTTTVDQPE